MSATLTLYISEHEAFDTALVRKILSGMASVHDVRELGTPVCDFEWRVESSRDSAIATFAKGGSRIDLWAMNDAALQFASAFASAYGRPIHLIDSSHGIPVPISGAESPSDLLCQILALETEEAS